MWQCRGAACCALAVLTMLRSTARSEGGALLAAVWPLAPSLGSPGSLLRPAWGCVNAVTIKGRSKQRPATLHPVRQQGAARCAAALYGAANVVIDRGATVSCTRPSAT